MDFKKFIRHQHDVVCNQKYDDVFPYSMHLDYVVAQGEKFLYLLKKEDSPFVGDDVSVVRTAIFAHDAIEDARLTYNDIVSELLSRDFLERSIATKIADIIYCVTDEKGKNRAQRKNTKYYTELKLNRLAVYVKLSDIAANTLYSRLSGSSMYAKYKKEWETLRKLIYIEEFKDFFDYIDSI